MPQLLGPPEARRPDDNNTTTATPVNRLISQTSELNLNRRSVGSYSRRRRGVHPTGPPGMGLTENLSATYSSSGNPCLDFFFHVVPDTSATEIREYLKSSWAHDALTTLKLICNLRGVRGTGKNNKESFYTAALWLHKHHPKTLANNLTVISSFGYLKDSLEILFRILKGAQARAAMKVRWLSKKRTKGKGDARKKYFLGMRMHIKYAGKTQKKENQKGKVLKFQVRRERKIKDNMEKMEEEKKRARDLRKEKQLAKSEKALAMYNNDMDYQFLHDKISTLFADLLKEDIRSLNSGEANNISLAGKWCPTTDSSYDRYTLVCESIAKKVFPRDEYPEYEGIEEAHYAYRVRDRLRKEVLVPLHKALKLPEVFMSAKKWNSISYNRVASVAMKTYTDIFLHRDNKGFRDYLQDVQLGNAKIVAGALLPHEIIDSLKCGSGAALVANLQWKRMVDDMLKKGKLTNCIAVCDVSGSMSGTPMEVAIALGILVSELSEMPWKGQVITFSCNPELHLIKGSSLQAKTDFVRKMDWGCNTDFQKVFDRILEVAVNGKLKEDQVVKRVFVFSDMEFDQASENPWEIDYQAIQRKFRASGYQKVPEIVFWNLRNSYATPVTATESGVALLSGFSKNLLTLFLEGGGEIDPKGLQEESNLEAENVQAKLGEINPEAVMEAAISGEEYKKLVVYDCEDAQPGESDNGEEVDSEEMKEALMEAAKSKEDYNYKVALHDYYVGRRRALRRTARFEARNEVMSSEELEVLTPSDGGKWTRMKDYARHHRKEQQYKSKRKEQQSKNKRTW